MFGEHARIENPPSPIDRKSDFQDPEVCASPFTQPTLCCYLRCTDPDSCDCCCAACFRSGCFSDSPSIANFRIVYASVECCAHTKKKLHLRPLLGVLVQSLPRSLALSFSLSPFTHTHSPSRLPLIYWHPLAHTVVATTTTTDCPPSSHTRLLAFRTCKQQAGRQTVGKDRNKENFSNRHLLTKHHTAHTHTTGRTV